MQQGKYMITGADGGLGSVVTGHLLQQGYALYAGVMNTEKADQLKAAYPEAWGKTLFATPGDLSVEADVRALVEQAGDVAGLVHLAGGYKGGAGIADHSTEDFDFLMNLNAKPTFLLLKYIVPLLKQRGGGSIVTIGARPVIHPLKGNALYAASKSAVVTMTLSVAEECREQHVRANCILPNTLQTRNNLSWATEAQFKKFTPLQDVADTIAYLLSDAAKGITGVSIPMYNELDW